MIISLTDVIILALCCYRLSLLLTVDDGPMDILARFRVLVGVQYNEVGQPYGTNNFAEGLVCQWCNSISIGIGLTLGYFGFLYMGWFNFTWLCLPFALSAFVVILSK